MTVTNPKVLEASGGSWIHCNQCLREARVTDVTEATHNDGRMGSEGWALFPSGWMNGYYRTPPGMLGPKIDGIILIFCSDECRLEYEGQRPFLDLFKLKIAP